MPMYIYVQVIRLASPDVPDKYSELIDEWIEYLKHHPNDECGNKIIDQCDDKGMNPVHIAVVRNAVQMLKKLAYAGAGMDMDIHIIYT